jgi:hypothetical protein
MDRCPICQVAVKPENVLRHLNDIHPRHPDTPALLERLKEEGRETVPRHNAAPIRIRRWQVAMIVGVILLAAGGYVVAPYLDPNRGFSRDSCINELQVPYHIHITLHIFVDGNHLPIPTNVGRSPACTKPLHTHDGEYDPNTQPARLHVESPIAMSFTLGDFFAIWGKTINQNQVDTCFPGGARVITMTVNGASSSEFGAVVLQDGQLIAISCG